MSITTEARRTRRRESNFLLSGDDDKQKGLSLRQNNILYLQLPKEQFLLFNRPALAGLDKKRYKLCALCASVVRPKNKLFCAPLL